MLTRFFRVSLGVMTIMVIAGVVFAEGSKMKYKKLTPEEERVIVYKGTEPPFSGKYYKSKEKGTYVCKRCRAPLYRSDDKFDSGSGWPSFDDEISGAVIRKPDPDGVRIEILCAACGAHLGHVFSGEGFTAKNIRHCVNSISLDFIPSRGDSSGRESRLNEKREVTDMKADEENHENMDVALEKAYFAGGCFWGVEYLLKNARGVVSTRVGYMGGRKSEPSYNEVCAGTTGHAEAVEVVFDPRKTDFEELARLFFEIHDPTQVNRQGPDVGEQYRSVIFYVNAGQRKIAEKLIKILEDKGYKIATILSKAETFWEAEEYHQDYYEKTGKQPYCHSYIKRF